MVRRIRGRIGRSRRPSLRRDGVVAFAFFLLPALLLLASAVRHHLNAETAAILISVALGMPVLWLTWATYRDARRPGRARDDFSLADIADRLANAVTTQWQAESKIRRLNDPYPLPISWVAASPEIADDWDVLTRLATSGAGWPRSAADGKWVAGPRDLAGSGSQLVDLLDRVPTRRLVVLGEPGAGKTMLMVRLVLDMLARRATGDPVPILVSVASWDPSNDDLDDWLLSQVVTDHPTLATAAPGDYSLSVAAALLEGGLIMPVLDGLDEIPEATRGSAITRINDALRPGMQLVVTCRQEEFRAAVLPRRGVGVKLRAAAAIELCPLSAVVIREYLRADADGPVAVARWTRVFAALGTDAPAGQALSTPLMVSLARIIYNPRPGEQPGAIREPDELCSPEFTDRVAVESALLDAFIPAAYRHNRNRRWDVHEAQRWLVYLAGAPGPDLAPWRTSLADYGRHELRRPRGFGLLHSLLLPRLAVGGIGAAAGIRAGTTSLIHLGLAVSTGIGFTIAQLFIVGGMIADEGLDYRRMWAGAESLAQVSPREDLAHERKTDLFALPRVLVGFLMISVLPGVIGGLVSGSVAGGISGGVTGLFVGGIWATSVQGRNWVIYTMGRIQLAFRRKLPWSMMAFLSDAHKKGVLRQAGAAYQFRHIELQRRLATRPPAD